MKTTSEILQDALLNGKHLTKFDFLNMTNSVCLAQRILELRQMGWNIQDKAVKGKGNLREYWLEPQEIARLKNQPHTKRFEDENEKNEQLTEPIENLVETASTVLKNDEAIYEQVGLGLPWQL